jgi:hypothetical protein
MLFFGVIHGLFNNIPFDLMLKESFFFTNITFELTFRDLYLMDLIYSSVFLLI